MAESLADSVSSDGVTVSSTENKFTGGVSKLALTVAGSASPVVKPQISDRGETNEEIASTETRFSMGGSTEEVRQSS